MKLIRADEHPVRSEADVVRVRQLVRARALEVKLSLVDQTKLVTAASEIARNTLIYGGGGDLSLEVVEDGIRRGIVLRFQDQGPGIEDLQRALTDGFTSGSGMGLGLGGAKRLVDEFKLDSAPGRGTCVTLTKWK